MPAQAEERGPDALDDEGRARHRLPVELARRFEEQPVLGHGVIDAGAGQDQPVVAAEGRDHDQDGHDDGCRAAEDHLGGRGPDTVELGELDAPADDIGRLGTAVDGQGDDVGDVGQEIEEDDDPGPEDEAQGDVPLGVLDLSGDVGHGVPGVRGEERADHGRSDGRQEHDPRQGLDRGDLAAGHVGPAGLPEGRPDWP